MGCEYVRRKWDVWKKGQVTWPRRWHCRALTRWDWNCDKYQYKLWVRTEYIYKEFRINMPVWCWCFSYLHPSTGIVTQPAFKPLNLFSIGDNPLPKTANQFHPGTLFSMQGTTATTTLSQAHPPPPPQWDNNEPEHWKEKKTWYCLSLGHRYSISFKVSILTIFLLVQVLQIILWSSCSMHRQCTSWRCMIWHTQDALIYQNYGRE